MLPGRTRYVSRLRRLHALQDLTENEQQEITDVMKDIRFAKDSWECAQELNISFDDLLEDLPASGL